MIANAVASTMNKEVEIKLPEEYYPNLFESEREEQSKIDQEFALHKARMDDFIYRHNKAVDEELEHGSNNS